RRTNAAAIAAGWPGAAGGRRWITCRQPIEDSKCPQLELGFPRPSTEGNAMTTPALTLYHNPKSRSAGARVLLEALGVDYAIKLVDFAAGGTRAPEFLAINP